MSKPIQNYYSPQRMQNNTQYNPSQFKAYQQSNPKIFDRSIPVQPLKHYLSNPNISLESNPYKGNPSVQSNTINKNIEYRTHFQANNYQANIQNNRQKNGDMAKSMFLAPQNQTKIQVPEDIQQPKKELLSKNPTRRSTRASQCNIDIPISLASSYIKEDLHGNFQKGKDQQEKANRSIPTFISRNDMKRSMVIGGTFQNIQSPSHFTLQKKLSKNIKKKITPNDFIKIKELGNGKYGRVSLVAQKTTGFVCAMKVIQKKLLLQQEITEQFSRQVKIQMFLNHPNIVKMYGCFDDTNNIYIILEAGTGGQLYHQLKKSLPLPQPKAAFIVKQVVQAVNQIHSLRIIHRDIKPENIVVHENVLKLCDFGWSVYQDNKLRTTFCGTPLYVCPEILKGNEYDEKIDIWSIGIMVYEMIVGENPFKITKQQELIKIVKDEIKIPSYMMLSDEIKHFLDRCLQKNPQKRASIKQLMNHPFFHKHQQKQKNKIINENE